jgi:hypothetical protein
MKAKIAKLAVLKFRDLYGERISPEKLIDCKIKEDFVKLFDEHIEHIKECANDAVCHAEREKQKFILLFN